MATTNPTSHPTMTEEHAIRRPLQSLSINAKNRATSMAVDDSTKVRFQGPCLANFEIVLGEPATIEHELT